MYTWFIFIREDLEERREEVAANPVLENLGKRKGLEGKTGCYKKYQIVMKDCISGSNCCMCINISGKSFKSVPYFCTIDPELI